MTSELRYVCPSLVGSSVLQFKRLWKSSSSMRHLGTDAAQELEGLCGCKWL